MHNCTCDAGFSGAHGLCSECATGKYKNTLGSAACTGCLENETSPSESTAVFACQCNVGCTGLACVACLAGTLKDVNGFSACQQCPSQAVSPTGSTSSRSCLCNLGFEGHSGGFKSVANASCTACAAGSYKLEGSSALCTPCGTGLYKETIGPGACVACPANSTAGIRSHSSLSCKCNAGFTGMSVGCQVCEPGKYKETMGSEQCKACTAGTYSSVPHASSNTSCTRCPTN